MSMNLYVSVNNSDISIRQTSTYETEICLMSSKGVQGSVVGKKAVRALRCYIAFQRLYYQNAFNRVGGKDTDGYLAYDMEHINEIESILKEGIEEGYIFEAWMQ